MFPYPNAGAPGSARLELQGASQDLLQRGADFYGRGSVDFASLESFIRAVLGPGSDADIEQHFTPSYRPWRQRIAFVPDADLFQAVKSGKASVVTDEIDRRIVQLEIPDADEELVARLSDADFVIGVKWRR